MTRVTCPHCARVYELADRAAAPGARLTCGRCHTAFEVGAAPRAPLVVEERVAPGALWRDEPAAAADDDYYDGVEVAAAAPAPPLFACAPAELERLLGDETGAVAELEWLLDDG